jgi:hypothetical protein
MEMTKLSRLLITAIPAVALSLGACGDGKDPGGGGTTGGTSGGGSGGAAGGSRSGGSGGNVTTGGTGGSDTTGGTGGGASAQGGAGGGAGAPGDGPEPSSGGTGGGSAGGQGGSTDGPPSPPAGACDYTPTPMALTKKLRFERINLMGLPEANNNRPYNGGITEVKFLPGTTDEFFVIRKGGQVYHYKMAGTTATLVASLAIEDPNGTEDCGLISLEFDPDFATNKLVFFAHCTGSQRNSKVARYAYDAGKLTDKQTIMTFSAPAGSNVWHSIGSMGFDKDKNLWVVHGEFNTGAPSQSDTSNLGKLIRIVPGRQAGMGGFMPAPGNPGGLPFYAKGLRSPWRASYHPGKNWYFIADVGPDPSDWEELNVVTAGGANLGWPGGTCNAGSLACWRSGLTTMKVTDEAALPENFATRAGRSVWVGAPYGNCGNDKYGGAMTGVTLTGDFFKGWVIGLTVADSGAKAMDKSLATFTMLSSVTQGPDGYLYATKFGKYHQGAEGENVALQGVYRILPE